MNDDAKNAAKNMENAENTVSGMHRFIKAFFHVLGFVIAVCAVILAGIDVVRAINPSLLTGQHGFLGFLFNLYPVVPALVLGFVGFLFAFGSKILSGSARRSHLMTASILLSILAIVLSGASFTTTHLFPEGMIHAPEAGTDTVPLNDSQELTERIDWAFGECTSGWSNVDTAEYPGVNYVNACASTKTIFVAYDSTGSAKQYKSAVRGKTAEYLRNDLGSALHTHDFASLAGDEWLIVGPGKGIKKLHSLWGGKVEWIDAETAGGEDGRK